jgi:cytoskeleton protein RodZ
MSITLGEKLRQAREARGISVSEVADQTRISPLYIKSIEEDDYRTLPGGIFNKGFVKSYAKTVGVDEQEALADYAALISSQNNNQTVEEPKTYRSQVLTDESARSSGLRTIVLAAVILGLMAAGILGLVKYLGNRQSGDVSSVDTNVSTNANSINTVSSSGTANVSNDSTGAPSMNDLKVVVRTPKAPVSVNSVVDGKRESRMLTADKPLEFAPKENLKIGYSKTLASSVELTINGKQISLPTAPATPKRSIVEFEITKDNLAKIWQDGKISFDGAANSAAPR